QRTFLFLLLLATLSCAPPPRPVVAPPSPVAHFAPDGRAQRVVLMSFDGLGADALAAQQDLPHFAALANEGTSARVVPVTPTATAVAHVAILTGADPQTNGIVGNRFHLAGTAPEQVAMGMDIDSDVETIVEAARRQGKRVGSISFPTLDGSTPRRAADFGLVWTRSLTPSRIIHLTRADFHREWVPPTWSARPQRRTSYSPIMRSRIEWSVPQRGRVDVDLVAYDTTDDWTANYDTFFIEDGDHEVAPDAKGWFRIAERLNGALYGSWSKLTAASPALDVTIYWGSIARTEAHPESFRQLIENELGFWPGAPDEHLAAEWLAGRDGIDDTTAIEQMDRLANYLADATLLTIQRMPFDLLLAYEPAVDEAMHQYLLPRGARVQRAAFVTSDVIAGRVADALDPSRDALVVTGDHGLAAIDTEVHLNALLGNAYPHWRAYGSGNNAHLYRAGGPDDTAAVVKLLTDSGYFERVETKTPQHHRNAGDIIVYAYPNIALSMSDQPPVRVTPDYFGQHGGLNTHREFHTVLFALGAGVTHKDAGEIQQTWIARYVSMLLGIEPPKAAQ
ncbi:MAG TPA: alkaline phosphatase family protein, partial [Thermoanaerobaculia bacterium]|nr:alkaline phosphatase family protein [Thermoanaerobaculia bacterium]